MLARDQWKEFHPDQVESPDAGERIEVAEGQAHLPGGAHGAEPANEGDAL